MKANALITEGKREYFSLPELKYATDGLEPYISAETVSFHYGKHTRGYYKKVNELLEQSDKSLQDQKTLAAVVREAWKAKNTQLFDQAAQAWNHTFYWNGLDTTKNTSTPSKQLKAQIDKDYGSIQDLKKTFIADAGSIFGSGWCWLVYRSGSLYIEKTHNAETPLTKLRAVPLMVCDVWEHAHYLDTQNDRLKYIKHWWNLINWDEVNSRFDVKESQ